EMRQGNCRIMRLQGELRQPAANVIPVRFAHQYSLEQVDDLAALLWGARELVEQQTIVRQRVNVHRTKVEITGEQARRPWELPFLGKRTCLGVSPTLLSPARRVKNRRHEFTLNLRCG